MAEKGFKGGLKMLEDYGRTLTAECCECGGTMEFNYSDYNPCYYCLKCGNRLEV